VLLTEANWQPEQQRLEVEEQTQPQHRQPRFALPPVMGERRAEDGPRLEPWVARRQPALPPAPLEPQRVEVERQPVVRIAQR
jgi:hypothetical protein